MKITHHVIDLTRAQTRHRFNFLLISLILIFFFPISAESNCRGCCSRHGGVVCISGKTECANGSPLSEKCSLKGCSKCGGDKQNPIENLTTKDGTDEKTQKYKRSYFGGWTDVDSNCLNTRHELLKARSLIPVHTKKSKGGRCLVTSGKWKDFYYDETLIDPKKIDIDHVVPLKHAWDTGAAMWSSKKRREFSEDPENLVITNLKYNRQKGPKTILEWMPINRNYACKYAKKWFYVKNKYGLKISSKEIEFEKMLKCP